MYMRTYLATSHLLTELYESLKDYYSTERQILDEQCQFIERCTL